MPLVTREKFKVFMPERIKYSRPIELNLLHNEHIYKNRLIYGGENNSDIPKRISHEFFVSGNQFVSTDHSKNIISLLFPLYKQKNSWCSCTIFT